MSLVKYSLSPPIHPDDQLHREAIIALSFSPSGIFLATASLDGRISVYATETGDLTDHVEMEGRAFHCVEWLNDEKFVVGLATGTVILVTRSENGILCIGFRVHSHGAVQCIAHQNGQIASGSGSWIFVSHINNPYEWVKTHTLTYSSGPNSNRTTTSSSHFQGAEPNATISSLCWAADADTLLASYTFHGVIIWDLKTSSNIGIIPGTDKMIIGQMSLSSDKHLLLLSNLSNGLLDLYSLKYQPPAKTRSFELDGMQKGALSIPSDFAHGNKVIVGGDAAGNPGLWQLGNEAPPQLLDHSFNVQENRSVTGIACYYNPAKEISLIATGTKPTQRFTSHSSRGFDPLVHIWHVSLSSTLKKGEQVDESGKLTMQNRRSSYLFWILAVFLISCVLYLSGGTSAEIEDNVRVAFNIGTRAAHRLAGYLVGLVLTME